MTDYEMTAKLSEKMGVTMEEAKAALEACDWDLLDAALMLERDRGAEGNAPAARNAPDGAVEARGGDRGRMLRSVGRLLGKALALGNRNRFEIRRKGRDEVLLDAPVTIMLLLLIFAFWVCVPVLAIGLFAGFRYSFSGPELGRKTINRAMDRAGEAAEKVIGEIRKDG